MKDRIVRKRGFQTLRPESEEVIDFEYQPGKCRKTFRVVALMMFTSSWSKGPLCTGEALAREALNRDFRFSYWTNWPGCLE